METPTTYHHQHSSSGSNQTSSTNNNNNSPEYLLQLLKDKRQLQTVPGNFVHLERILDQEISRVRSSVLSFSGDDAEIYNLPEPVGSPVTLSEKLTIPVKEYPDFNFVGRLLGPRGMTAKQLELETGCKILIRGRGSMRDKNKEEQMRGKAKWEHLNEDLHVLVTVEDSKNRATIKLKHAIEQVKKLLIPSPENEDELKKRQLMELALLNGTYRGLHSNGHLSNAVAVNNLHNSNNNGNFGVVMMAAGPPQFLGAGGALLPAGMMASPPSSTQPFAALPLIISTDATGSPVILAAQPPPTSVFGPGLPLSATAATTCKAAAGPPSVSAAPGIIFQHPGPVPQHGTPPSAGLSSPGFEFPQLTSPIAGEFRLPVPPPAVAMTPYVH